MSSVNPYSSASVPGIVSQFIPEQLPTELILNKLNQEQQIQDTYRNQTNALLDYEQRAAFQKDKNKIKEVKGEIKDFVSKAMTMDFNNPESRQEVLNFYRNLKNNEDLKTIAYNTASYDEMVKQRQKIIESGKTGIFHDIELAKLSEAIDKYEKSEGISQVSLPGLQGDLDRLKKRNEYFETKAVNKFLQSHGITENYQGSGFDMLYQKSVESNDPQLRKALEQYLQDYATTPEGRQDKAIYDFSKEYGAYDNIKNAKGEKVDYTFQNYLNDISGVEKFRTYKEDVDLKVAQTPYAKARLNQLKEEANAKLIQGQAAEGVKLFEIAKDDLKSNNAETRENAFYDIINLQKQAYNKLTPYEKAKVDKEFKTYMKESQAELELFKMLKNDLSTGKDIISSKYNVKGLFSWNLSDKLKGLKLETLNAYKKEDALDIINSLINAKQEEIKLNNSNKLILKKVGLDDAIKVNNVIANIFSKLGPNLITKALSSKNIINFDDIDFYQSEDIKKMVDGETFTLSNAYSIQDVKKSNAATSMIAEQFNAFKDVVSFSSDEDSKIVQDALTNNQGKLPALQLVLRDNGSPEIMFTIPGKTVKGNGDIEANKIVKATFKNAKDLKGLMNNNQVTNMFEVVFDSFGEVGKKYKEKYLGSAVNINKTPTMSDEWDVNTVLAKELGSNNYNSTFKGSKHSNRALGDNIMKVSLSPASKEDWNFITNLKKKSETYNPYESIENQLTLKMADGLHLLDKNNRNAYISTNKEQFNTLVEDVISKYNGPQKSLIANENSTTRKAVKNDLMKLIIKEDAELITNMSEQYKTLINGIYNNFKNVEFPATKDFLKAVSDKNYINNIKL